MPDSRSARIKEVLGAQHSSIEIHIEDESRMHSHGGIETHLKLVVVTDEFEGLSRIARQRKINELLKPEFDSGLHALSLKCLTKSEAKVQVEGAFQSPPCASHSKSN